MDRYIALTEFARDKFIAGGLPAERITVKPNFLEKYPAPGTGDGGYALFVGRLSREKGIETLLRAWAELRETVPLRIVGDGPLSDLVADAAHTLSGVTWLGKLGPEQVREQMRGAAILVVPSEWYEGGPLTMIEAWGVGLPVVGSNMGAMSTAIKPHQNGLLFRPGDAGDLTAKVRWLWDQSADRQRMRDGALQTFHDIYSPERNYEYLIGIYDGALQQYKTHG